MDVCPCDVRGCTETARWVRVSRADADLHEYLCPEHWHMLRSYSLMAAAAYMPIGSSRSAREVPASSSVTPMGF